MVRKKKETALAVRILQGPEIFGAPGRNRTLDQELRRHLLYPTELRTQRVFYKSLQAQGQARKSRRSKNTRLSAGKSVFLQSVKAAVPHRRAHVRKKTATFVRLI